MSDADDENALTSPADMLVRMTELGVRAQSAILQAELAALARMLPGLGEDLKPAEPATEAEVESGFDNMPV